MAWQEDDRFVDCRYLSIVRLGRKKTVQFDEENEDKNLNIDQLQVH